MPRILFHSPFISFCHALVARVRPSLAIAVLLLVAAVPTFADTPMAMRVSPAQAFAPATLRIRVQLQPAAENHALELIIDSADYYRSSLVPLAGERAPRVLVLDFKGCPSGEYEVRSVLTDRVGRERASALQHVMVVSPVEE
jgi:hypothetical protein